MKLRTPLHLHDIAFRGVSQREGGVFFVQIGAADGKNFDPIHPFVKHFGWKGILVEPLVDLFAMLNENYAGQPGLVFENVAITERQETRTMSRIPLSRSGTGNVPGWAYSASTLVPEKTRFSAENSPAQLHSALSSAVEQEDVQCVSLEQLLSKHGVASIDVLQIDAEGYDANILKQLDFSRYEPAIINMEWQWLTEAEQLEVSQRLTGQGYHLYRCQADMLATADPVESYIAQVGAPRPDSVPRFFPGVTGLSARRDVDQKTLGCAPDPSLFELIRYRGTTSPLDCSVEMLSFLTSVDGRRTYREISEITGIDETQLVRWGHEMRMAYVLD